MNIKGIAPDGRVVTFLFNWYVLEKIYGPDGSFFWRLLPLGHTGFYAARSYADYIIGKCPEDRNLKVVDSEEIISMWRAGKLQGVELNKDIRIGLI